MNGREKFREYFLYSGHGSLVADVGIPGYRLRSSLDSAVCLPSGKQTAGVSSFHSGFGKRQIVLDFENSAVQLPSAKENFGRLVIDAKHRCLLPVVIGPTMVCAVQAGASNMGDDAGTRTQEEKKDRAKYRAILFFNKTNSMSFTWKQRLPLPKGKTALPGDRTDEGDIDDI
ncbi:hypothetical protein Tco_0308991 [Tanacetum coccineum]